MKKIKLFLFALCLAGLPSLALAYNFGSQSPFDSYSLQSGESVAGDVYAGAGSVMMSGSIAEDFTAAGGTVLVSGKIGADALLAGGTVNVAGEIADDLRLAGGTVILTGSTGGDVLAVGGQITVSSGAKIGGSLRGAGGNFVLEGGVSGKVLFAGGEVYINAPVAGDVELAAGKIVLGPQAIIGGNLVYRSSVPAVIDQNAKIAGRTEFTQIDKGAGVENVNGIKHIFAVVIGVFGLMSLLMKICGTLLMALVLKKMSHWLVSGALDDFWRSAGRGFAVAVLMPVGALILFASLVGFPIGVLVLLGYFAWMILAYFVSPLIAGAWVYQKVKKTNQVVVDWKIAILGVVVLGLVGMVPVAGWLVRLLVCLASVGMIFRAWYTHIWLNR